MIKNLVIGLALVMMLMTGISFAAETDKEQAAVIAAEKWLALVDTVVMRRVGKQLPNISREPSAKKFEV
jgi:hypothetical protein